MTAQTTTLRTVNFDNLFTFVGEVLATSFDARYFAVRAWHIDTNEYHFFVCEQYAHTDELTVIYFGGNDPEDSCDVWELVADSGQYLSDEQIALNFISNL